MQKNLPMMIMTTLTVALLAISFRAPFYLSDSNSFLRDFVNHEFLAILGFIVALTLGFAGNIHLELNRLEDETGNAFRRTRAAVKRSAISLMAAFIVAGALVVIKPMLIQEPIYAAVANSIAIVIVFFNLAVLYDLSETVFGIPTVKKIKESQNAKL